MPAPEAIPTPSQTIGPFFHPALAWPDAGEVVPPDRADAITIGGRVCDAEGRPVDDALVETWQADEHGVYSSGGSGEAARAFRGMGRSATDAQGGWRIVTVKPGPVVIAGHRLAPHIEVSLFARGLLDRLVGRLYFPEEREANRVDPVLALVDPSRRHTLVAAAVAGGYRWDIQLRGDDETVFFDL